jgi:hypothetical protein
MRSAIAVSIVTTLYLTRRTGKIRCANTPERPKPRKQAGEDARLSGIATMGR